MLAPKKVKYRKQQKGRMRVARRAGSTLNFGKHFPLLKTDCPLFSFDGLDSVNQVLVESEVSNKKLVSIGGPNSFTTVKILDHIRVGRSYRSSLAAKMSDKCVGFMF